MRTYTMVLAYVNKIMYLESFFAGKGLEEAVKMLESQGIPPVVVKLATNENTVILDKSEWNQWVAKNTGLSCKFR